MKRFFAIVLAAMMLMSMLPAVSYAAQYATVVGGWLRLRADDNFNAETITSYYTGTQVEILSKSGGWYHVRTPDGRVGYMYGQYLQVGTTITPTGSENAWVTSHNGYGVRLRKGPGTGYRVIRTYDVGTPVTVLQRGNYWCKLNVGGTVGYMMTQFLNFGGSSAPVPGDGSVICYATIWSRNGYGVRLRTGPDKSYSKIGVYSVGTTVAVLEKGAVWDRIRVGSRVGWMMNEFLSYQNSNEVTSVSLNTYNPAVGTVLSVQAITPSNATVGYSWYVGDDVKGNASTYTVTSADVGKAIQLRVKGTGSYTGTVYSPKTSAVLSDTQISGLKLSTTAPVVGNVLKATITPAEAKVIYAWKVGGYQVSNAESYTVTANDVGKQIELIVTGTGVFHGTLSATTAAVAASGVVADVSVVNETTAGAAAPTVGDKLAASLSPAQATVTYQWNRDGAPIQGATGSAYVLTAADEGKQLSVSVKGTGAYAGEKTSAATAKVLPKPTVPVIDVIGLPEGTVGTAYSTRLNAQGGGTIAWKLVDGSSLPAGLTLNQDGSITGTPTAAGSVTFFVLATNAAGTSAAQSFTLKVNSNIAPAPVILTGSVPDGKVGEAYTSTTLQANNGQGVLTWSVSGGYLPANLTLSTSGTLSGTPAVNGEYQFTVTVTDEADQSASITYSIQIDPADAGSTPPVTVVPPQIMTDSLADGKVGKSYSQTLEYLGTGAMSWTLSGGSLPQGLQLSSGGVISGEPQQVGDYQFTVLLTATEQTVNNTSAKTLWMTIYPADTTPSVPDPSDPGVETAPVITTGSLANGKVGEAYSGSVAADGSGALSWSVTGGNLPSGLTLSSNGAISGTPAAVGSFQFTLTVTATEQATNKTAVKSFTITIAEADPEDTYTPPVDIPPQISSGSVPDGMIGATYSAQLNATATNAVSWEATGGELPSGVTLSSNGTISGTPAAGSEGDYAFTVTVTDTVNHLTDAQTFRMKVKPAPVSKHTVSVSGGTGAGEYEVGAWVSVTAENRDDYDFIGWDASGISVSNEKTVGFNMPDNDVSLTAKYQAKPKELSKPTGLTWTTSESGVTASWNPVDGAQGYMFYCHKQAEGNTPEKPVNCTSYTFTGALSDGDRFYIAAIGDGTTTLTSGYSESPAYEAPITNP